MDVIAKYFLYFIIYSFIGWSLEVLTQLIFKKRFINRGFLLGPICPIYGYGALAIVVLIGKNANDPLGVFLKAILVCSILEYLTSYLMEKLFKARWWDYSNQKYNINGRICVETMLPFGLLGVFMIYIAHPFVAKVVSLLSDKVEIVLAAVFFIIYLVDNIVSFNVMSKIKREISSVDGDNTELIKKRVLEWIEENSFLYRHIKSAYPRFQITKKTIKKKNSCMTNQKKKG